MSSGGMNSQMGGYGSASGTFKGYTPATQNPFAGGSGPVYMPKPPFGMQNPFAGGSGPVYMPKPPFGMPSQPTQFDQSAYQPVGASNGNAYAYGQNPDAKLAMLQSKQPQMQLPNLQQIQQQWQTMNQGNPMQGNPIQGNPPALGLASLLPFGGYPVPQK